MTPSEAPRSIILIIEEEDDGEVKHCRKSLVLLLASLTVVCALLSFACLMLMDNSYLAAMITTIRVITRIAMLTSLSISTGLCMIMYHQMIRSISQTRLKQSTMERQQAPPVDNLEKKGSCKIFLVLLTLVAISMILGAVLLLMWMEIRISIMKSKDDGLVTPSHSYFQRFDSEKSFRFARSISYGRRRYYTVEHGDPMKYNDKFALSPGEIRKRILMAVDRERGR